MLTDLILALFISVAVKTTTQYDIQQPMVSNSQELDSNNPVTQVQKVWRGKVSSYNASWGGCLGCSKKFDEKGQLYYTTFCGDRLDDNKYTIAFNHLPCGTHVSLINLSNGKSTGAVINDRGGFESLGRIADLSDITMRTLDAKTDKDLIEITTIP